MMSADSAPHLSPTTTIALPWRVPRFVAVKGIIHAPSMAPSDLTVTSLAKALPYSQAQQEPRSACRNPDAASKFRCLAQGTGGMLNVVAMDVTDAESGGPSG